MTTLLTSFIIGFVAASLPGAVQMTMLQTGLSKKIKEGIRFGVGAATMDGLLLIASYFGVAQLIKITWLYLIIGICGAIYMFFLGISGIYESLKNADKTKAITKKTFLKGALLVILHPPTLLYFIGVSSSQLAIHNLTLPTVIVSSIFLFVGAITSFLLVAAIGLSVNKFGKTQIVQIIQILAASIVIYFGIKLSLDLIKLI